MIGNDIVDLVLAKKESNWQRKGFLEKIFTPKEQLQILQSKNPEIMVWDLWSKKEAVYKIYNRQSGIRAFIPLKIECFNNTTEIGEVVCMNQLFFTQTEITDSFIHSVAVTKISDFNEVTVLENFPETQKTNGIPFLPNKNIFVSISHHGNFQRMVTLNH